MRKYLIIIVVLIVSYLTVAGIHVTKNPPPKITIEIDEYGEFKLATNLAKYRDFKTLLEKADSLSQDIYDEDGRIIQDVIEVQTVSK